MPILKKKKKKPIMRKDKINAQKNSMNTTLLRCMK